MCRNIRNLYNFKPPATDGEIHASSLQFVRKLSGFNRPSKANEEAFNRAVAEVARAARRGEIGGRPGGPGRRRRWSSPASRCCRSPT